MKGRQKRDRLRYISVGAQRKPQCRADVSIRCLAFTKADRGIMPAVFKNKLPCWGFLCFLTVYLTCEDKVFSNTVKVMRHKALTSQTTTSQRPLEVRQYHQHTANLKTASPTTNKQAQLHTSNIAAITINGTRPLHKSVTATSGQICATSNTRKNYTQHRMTATASQTDRLHENTELIPLLWQWQGLIVGDKTLRKTPTNTHRRTLRQTTPHHAGPKPTSEHYRAVCHESFPLNRPLHYPWHCQQQLQPNKTKLVPQSTTNNTEPALRALKQSQTPTLTNKQKPRRLLTNRSSLAQRPTFAPSCRPNASTL